MTKIDAVITWVDGADPEHRAARLAAMRAEGSTNNSNGTYETRFSNLGEIYYCIASILKYAPFINRIHVVTASQVPEGLSSFPASGLCSEGRIVLVDHSEIFRNVPEALPTFNSLTIETMLWAIPDLSEHFLYFNDDFFLNAPIAISDLISADGKIVLRGRMRSIWPLAAKYRLRKLRYKTLRSRQIPAHFKTAQMHAARLAGLSQYLDLATTLTSSAAVRSVNFSREIPTSWLARYNTSSAALTSSCPSASQTIWRSLPEMPWCADPLAAPISGRKP